MATAESIRRVTDDIERPASRLFESILEGSGNHGGPDAAIRVLARALQQMDFGNRRIRKQFARGLEMSSTEFNAFMLISQSKSMTPKLLATDLGLTNGAVTAITDRLEAADMIARVPNPADRRSVFLELSKKGDQAIDWIGDEYLGLVSEVVRESPSILDPDVAALMNQIADSMSTGAQRIKPRTF